MTKSERIKQEVVKRREAFIADRAKAEEEWNNFFRLADNIPEEDRDGVVYPEKREFNEVFPSLFEEFPSEEKYKSEVRAITPYFQSMRELEKKYETEAMALLGLEE